VSDADDSSDDGVSRRWLIRILVGLGIGLPILIEGATFLGLVGDRLFGGGDEETATATQTPTPGVGVGDELLPETPPSDTLTDAVVNVGSGGDERSFQVTVSVENTTDAPYELRLGTVTTRAGDSVEGNASTGQIQPGETGEVTNAWPLPPDETPETLAVTGVAYPESGAEVTERTVRLRNVPLRG